LDALATVLESVFGSTVRRDDVWAHTVVRSDNGFFTTRVRTNPVAELFVTPRALDGFTLTLRGERIKPGAEFADALTMATNDHALAHVWLDDIARRALLDSAYEFETEDYRVLDALVVNPAAFDRPQVIARRIWTYELANDELVVSKGSAEGRPERIATALQTACTIVSRCRRWAAAYGDIARTIGADARAEVELGGPPVITSNRYPVEVTLSLLRRLPGEKTGRLRTLVTAKRIGLQNETSWSLVDEAASRTMIPPLPTGTRIPFELEPYRLRAPEGTELDELTKKLVVAARPSVVVADADSIDVWFDGAPMEVERLDPAFALAAHLAVGHAVPQGPYR
jgi:hypothetical protein